MNKQAILLIANEILSTKIITISELLNDSFSKIAMSAAELLFGTSQRSIKYAKGCVATNKRNDPANGRWTFSVKCHLSKSKGPYDVRFKLVPGKGQPTKGILGREIEISCNCNAWKYNGADSNALQKDYSERQYSNGQPARVRDPQRRYLICKHVASCVPLFKRFIIPDAYKKVSPKQILVKQPEQKEIQKKIVPKLFTKQPDIEKKETPKTFTRQPIEKNIRQPLTKTPSQHLRPLKQKSEEKFF